ncbi:unnamed protein product [Cunninghamella blakesleeana]
MIPTLAVIIVPVGYFAGIQLRESQDEKAMKAQLEQLSSKERQTLLEQQRLALLEEQQALKAKLDQN